MNVSQKDFRKYLRQELQDLYPDREIESLGRILLEHFLSMTRSQIVSHPGITLSPDRFLQIKEIIEGLKKQIPVQYMLGQTEFYGIHLKVSQDVLIPRPETEELADWIIKDYKGKTGIRILDIGTGSGNIAIVLALNLPGSEVWATDVSAPALKLAKENARSNSCMVHFLFSDILHATNHSLPGSFDVMVSNPPYIPERERDSLPRNVEGNEPGLALFVEDEDPLLYYRRIAAFARLKLKQGGKVYVEIHENFGKETVKLFQKESFHDVKLRKDLNGKDRMVCASIL